MKILKLEYFFTATQSHSASKTVEEVSYTYIYKVPPLNHEVFDHPVIKQSINIKKQTNQFCQICRLKKST